MRSPVKTRQIFTNVGAVTIEVIRDPDNTGALQYVLESVNAVGPGVVQQDFPYEVTSEIQLTKLTEGSDNDTPPGPYVLVGDTVT